MKPGVEIIRKPDDLIALRLYHHLNGVSISISSPFVLIGESASVLPDVDCCCMRSR